MPTIALSTGETDYYEVDDFTDPWRSATCDVVVFQPGIIRHTDFLFHLVPLLSRNVRFIRRDLRGHGRSSGGTRDGYPYTLDTLVDEMAEFVDKVVGERPVHWIGESTAGMLSVAFAVKYPEKLSSLILMSSPLVLNDAFHKMVSEPFATQGEAMRKLGLIEWQRSRPLSKLGTNQASETMDMGRFQGELYLKWYDEMLLKHDVEGVAKYCDFVRDIDVRDQLEAIKVPVLMVAPTKSFASPLALNEEMARRIKDSRLAVIDGVGHMVYIDEPEKTCSAILDWVNDLAKRESQK